MRAQASQTKGGGPCVSLPGRLAMRKLEHARMNAYAAARERIQIDLERDLGIPYRETEHTADRALIVMLADGEHRVAGQARQHARTFVVADDADIDDIAGRAERGIVGREALDLHGPCQ